MKHVPTPYSPAGSGAPLEDDDYSNDPPSTARYCPNCDRVMSVREADAQGSCNDCYDGTFPWL